MLFFLHTQNSVCSTVKVSIHSHNCRRITWQKARKNLERLHFGLFMFPFLGYHNDSEISQCYTSKKDRSLIGDLDIRVSPPQWLLLATYVSVLARYQAVSYVFSVELIELSKAFDKSPLYQHISFEDKTWAELVDPFENLFSYSSSYWCKGTA